MSCCLLDWFRIGEQLERVLGEFPRNTWHVGWTPRKYVPVLTEKFDERAFLCGVQAGGHVDRLAGVGWMYLMCSSVVGRTEGPVD